MKKILSLMVTCIAVVLIPIQTFSSPTFYKDKTIRLIVGFSPGGGFDTYARFFARHMSKHIPGHPKFVVQNMPGAGSLTATNHLYNVAKPNGLNIGHINGGLAFNQIMGKAGVKFDFRKFEYIGVPVKGVNVCLLSKRIGIKSAKEWMASKMRVKLGSSALGTYGTNNLRILQKALDFPIHLVLGYSGYGPVRLAVLSGELDGLCVGWESAKMTWRREIEAGDVNILMQCGAEPLPDLPKVPLMINFAKTDEARKLVQVGMHDAGAIIRPFLLPPGTPNERVQILRKAFHKTLNDKEFLADAEKVKLSLDPLTGEEIEKVISGIFKLEPLLVEKLEQILYHD